MSKKVLWPSLVVIALGFTHPVSSQDPGDARAIVEKAIEAQGGAEKLKKQQAARGKAKGTVFAAGIEAPFKVDVFQQLPTKDKPGKYKLELKLDLGGIETTIIKVLDGDKGWQSVDGQVQDVDDKELAEGKATLYAAYLTMLTPLLDDKRLELKSLGESKINGKAAVGVKVTSKGYPDIQLHFDKADGLLIKLTRPGQDPISKQDVVQEDFFSGYKAVDGLKLPYKVRSHQDGKKFMEMDILEFSFVPSFEAKVFARPK